MRKRKGIVAALITARQIVRASHGVRAKLIDEHQVQRSRQVRIGRLGRRMREETSAEFLLRLPRLLVFRRVGKANVDRRRAAVHRARVMHRFDGSERGLALLVGDKCAASRSIAGIAQY